ncbi:MAG: hypothetical protein BroJett021_38800 [Chloroflexota bacterium]|jgi:AcrR family transcriptional regulator|nr:TetR/AcrR family transcriptional regulator [Caldilinea sp.]GIK74892.1 MAG: hypothetical protein BroJett021_38800 [Chloroflexota bacterium]
MPRPRFQKLSIEKQQAILEAAAREFSAHGYEGASINKILETAQLSKGAAYYYFDDKADLFAATVNYYAGDLISELNSMVENITAERFWSTLEEMYVKQFVYFHAKPWAFGTLKAAGRLSDAEMVRRPALAALMGGVVEGLTRFLQQGRSLGVVRSDLPDSLLAALFIGVDDAGDRWLLARWETLTRDELLTFARQIMDGIRRMLAA